MKPAAYWSLSEPIETRGRVFIAPRNFLPAYGKSMISLTPRSAPARRNGVTLRSLSQMVIVAIIITCCAELGHGFYLLPPNAIDAADPGLDFMARTSTRPQSA